MENDKSFTKFAENVESAYDGSLYEGPSPAIVVTRKYDSGVDVGAENNNDNPLFNTASRDAILYAFGLSD